MYLRWEKEQNLKKTTTDNKRFTDPWGKCTVRNDVVTEMTTETNIKSSLTETRRHGHVRKVHSESGYTSIEDDHRWRTGKHFQLDVKVYFNLLKWTGRKHNIRELLSRFRFDGTHVFQSMPKQQRQHKKTLYWDGQHELSGESDPETITYARTGFL